MAALEWDAAAGLLAGPAHDNGYHTRIAAGTRVHHLRESLDHALGLLDAGGGRDQALAAIAAVLVHQVADPSDPACGAFPWYAEEPVADMRPPDLNWADFCGARLAELLVRHPGALPPALAERMRSALRLAALCIFRRNSGPGYTNIALMGAGVALCAAELLDEPWLAEFGRRRLARVLALHAEEGGFGEYSSPVYTTVALHEAERIRLLVRDRAALALAGRLRRLAWEEIAGHWHQPTGQWAGPNSRTYSDLLAPWVRAAIAPLAGLDPGERPAAAWTAHAAPCPDDLLHRFHRPPAEEEAVRRLRREGGAFLHGTTWMDAEACLASAEREDTWTQRRPLLAYWRLGDGPPACLRLRLLHRGKDFASGLLCTAQRGRRVLAAATLRPGGGDWHLFLDRPADGRFDLGPLALRVELAAPDAAACDLGSGRLALAAGRHRLAVHPAPGRGPEGPLAWAATTAPGRAWVEAPLRRAEGRTRLEELGELLAALGLELLREGEAPAEEAPRGGASGHDWRWTWQGLAVTAPRRCATLAHDWRG